MKGNGMVSPVGTRTIAVTLSAIQAIQASSIHQVLASDRIPNIAHRLNRVGAELGAEPGDVNVDDIRPGVERTAPDVGQDLLARAQVARVPHQVSEEQERALRDG